MITSLKNFDLRLNVFMLFNRSVIHLYSHFLIKLDLRCSFVLSRVEGWWLWFLQNFEISLIYRSIGSFTNTIKKLVIIYWCWCKNFPFFIFFLTLFRFQYRLKFSVTLNKSFSMLHSSWLEISSYFWLIGITLKSFILNDLIQINFDFWLRWLQWFFSLR